MFVCENLCVCIYLCVYIIVCVLKLDKKKKGATACATLEMSDLKCMGWLSPLSKLKALIWPGYLVQKTEISNYHIFASIFSFLLHAFLLLLLFSPFHFSLQMLYDCLTFSAGVILPVHRVCGLHHVAVLHAGRRHRQCSNLCLSHRRAERLPVHHSWSRRASSVAGKAVKF